MNSPPHFPTPPLPFFLARRGYVDINFLPHVRCPDTTRSLKSHLLLSPPATSTATDCCTAVDAVARSICCPARATAAVKSACCCPDVATASCTVAAVASSCYAVYAAARPVRCSASTAAAVTSACYHPDAVLGPAAAVPPTCCSPDASSCRSSVAAALFSAYHFPGSATSSPHRSNAAAAAPSARGRAVSQQPLRIVTQLYQPGASPASAPRLRFDGQGLSAWPEQLLSRCRPALPLDQSRMSLLSHCGTKHVPPLYSLTRCQSPLLAVRSDQAPLWSNKLPDELSVRVRDIRAL